MDTGAGCRGENDKKQKRIINGEGMIRKVEARKITHEEESSNGK